MRKVLFVTVVLAMLLSAFAGSAVAAEPRRIEQATCANLGEVWGLFFGGFVPGERVDTYMYRPSTEFGWPWPFGPDCGTWWWTGPASLPRRQSWPNWQYADMFGYYFTMFMLPRDEVWYPCSFPLKWKCNYVIDPWTTEYHSPATQPFGPNYWWPYPVNPMDTVQPVEVWLCNQASQCNSTDPLDWAPVWIVPFEITGYYWP
jgi:hypothetical protein